MDYIHQLRKFVNSQYLYTGLRITAGVIIPSLVLYHYQLLGQLIAIPLGALCVSLTDNPGPARHRRNALAASIVLNFLVVLITGFLRENPLLISLLIIVFGMLFSLGGVYGNRINSVCVIALLVFVFNIDGHLGKQRVLTEGLWFTVGGVWYALMSLFLHTLSPYRLIQQSLGECVIETANYLHIKSFFYDKDPNYEDLYQQLMKHQVSIRKLHDDLREMLFKTRNIVRESTTKGRVLMMMFLDTIDLFERIMTSQQDYEKLHASFDDTGILEKYQSFMNALVNELHEIGLAIQSGTSSKQEQDMDALLLDTRNAFFKLRNEKLTPDRIENFIMLRQILYSLEDITERIKRLNRGTTYDKKISSEYKNEVQLDKFVSHQNLHPELLIDNLSLKSSHFRHAVRLTTAMLIGYIISLLFPFGHGYWILMTITTIIKPAYSITKSRNIQRLSGTFIGAAIGFTVVYFIHNHTALFLLMLFCMILSYSLLKVNYFISSLGITIFVLISFNFLSPNNITHVLTDRVVDTTIGSVIAYVFAVFVLPVWEHEQISGYILEALEANRKYFNTVANTFTGKSPDVTSFKFDRKNAFVALANLSDNFQRMLSEPKNKQHNMQHYHQFVALSHMLTSYIASLSYYAQRSGEKYASDEFIPLIEKINRQFQTAIDTYKNNSKVNIENDPASAAAISKRLNDLLEMRKKELISGVDDKDTTIRKTLSDLKTIMNQFELINTITIDEIKILEKVAA